ncbi:DEAD/DEAH box helicase [Luteolibacter marinus]|uniref:DEAD/DEAH box helicase n=1 Tax=Luteolibacter marinus TaxID=2776705 RepID=UPI0018669028|nr:DEAD/DEAH box helicase [Luteolibacter marinus]
MQDALEHIAERPALRAWMVSGGWTDHFDQSTLKRARGYARPGTVSDVEWVDLDSTGELIVNASVQGSRRAPYETSIVFSESRGEWTIETECTCPVVHECKHAAATLLLLQEHLPDEDAPPRHLQFELPFDSWLNEVEQAGAAPGDDDEPSPPAGHEEFLAYCIEEAPGSDSRFLQFVLRVGRRLGDGSVRILGGVASVDPDKPARFMTADDTALVTLFQKRQMKHGTFGAMPLEGPDWDELLAGALVTGRLYFGKEANDHRGTTLHRPLEGGESLHVDAYWESLPDGSVRPKLRGALPGNLFLPVVPPRYINPKRPSLGPLTSSLPPAVLATWTRGPVIRPENIPGLIERLSRFPGATLPKPTLVQTVSRPATPPQPVLRITKVAFGPSWERVDWIIGEVFFQYGDSPRLRPLSANASRQHTAMVEGRRVIWNRDPKAERIAETELLRYSLIPLSKKVPERSLDSATRHAVIPDAPHPDQPMAWLDFLQSNDIGELRGRGWKIEVDPRAGLTARNASSFVPAIEAETAHGIDWFRFDISYEIDGKRFSLIPVIAQAIAKDYPPADSPDLPEQILIPCENPEDGYIRFPGRQLMEIVDQVRHLFVGGHELGTFRIDRLSAAAVADSLQLDGSDTARSLARLGRGLRDIKELPDIEVPSTVQAGLRAYQLEGFRWLQFLTAQGLHGILADDMGLGKTLQTLVHLATEHARQPGRPSLVVAPTSVVPNWAAEAAKFVPSLKVVTLHGPNRASRFDEVAGADLVLTSYPLLGRDLAELGRHDWHVIVLDEAQHIKNPKAIAARSACQLKASHRLCLSGTPMENHLGELWSLMRFLMPGFLGDEKSFNTRFRKPIERERSSDIQLALNRRVSPLILRRTKDQVATELPKKTEIVHHIDLTKKQTALYESVRASMDRRVLDAIAAKGLAKSHIIVLDALLKLRQICCHPQLLKSPAAQKVEESAKFDYLTQELLPTLLEEGRRILVFSQFTSMLSRIQAELETAGVPFLKLTGQTRNRGELVKQFQDGTAPVFLISLKAGGTGLNLTAADTVIHYDPWWNPAAENQATDRAHRIGQTKPIFVHKLVCRGTIEDRILDLQKHKAALVEALLSDETAKLKIDPETLSHLLAPLE